MALIDPQHTYQKQAKPTPEALVRTHMPLVRRIAWHVHARVASAIDVEDLAQIGMVALVEAAPDVEERADEAIDRGRLQEAITAVIRTLPEREAMVLQLYFVEEMNLEEIGQTLGVGAARICQIKKAALDRVRASLTDWA